MIESDRLLRLNGEVAIVDTPSASGQGQRIARCPDCKVALWSHYAGSGPLTSFIRVGTFDEPDRFPPDVHIFTSTKQPWVVLPPGSVAFAQYYDRKAVWTGDSLARFEQLRPRIEAYRGGAHDAAHGLLTAIDARGRS